MEIEEKPFTIEENLPPKALELAEKIVKTRNVIAIRFGNKGWKELIEEFKMTNRNPTELFLEKVIITLENEGYDLFQITRWIFEDAIDIIVTLQLKAIAKVIQQTNKVVKWVFLPNTINKYID